VPCSMLINIIIAGIIIITTPPPLVPALGLKGVADPTLAPWQVADCLSLSLWLAGQQARASELQVEGAARAVAETVQLVRNSHKWHTR
jgi:hypothetical protein